MWTSLNGEHSSQIDYIIVDEKLKCMHKNSRTCNSASNSSDNSLVMATFLVLLQTKKRMRIARTAYWFDTDMIIHDKEVCQQFEMRICGAFRPFL